MQETETAFNHTDIKGFFDFSDLYENFVWSCPDPAIAVEVGVFEGKSACYMANAIKRSGKDISFYAVDIWSSDELYKRFQRNMYMAGVNSLLKPVRAPSVLAARQFKDESLDFVYIDADHSKENVIRDILAWRPKVRPGGILAGHDYWFHTCPGVVNAVNELIGYKNIAVWGRSWVYRVPKEN